MFYYSKLTKRYKKGAKMNQSKKRSLRQWIKWHKSGAVRKPILPDEFLVIRAVSISYKNGYITLMLGSNNSQSNYWVVANCKKFHNLDFSRVQRLDRLPGNAIPGDLFYAHENGYKSYHPELSAKNVKTTKDSLSAQNNKGAEMVKINSVNINGKKVKYVGQPLEAFTFDSSYWVGRSNIIYSQSKEEIYIIDLNDAFAWMKVWSCNQDSLFDYGYILDFTTKTVYYDNEKVLDYLKRMFLRFEWEEYFTDFKKVDFRKK